MNKNPDNDECREAFEQWLPVRCAEWLSVGVRLSSADINSMWDGYKEAWAERGKR